MSTSGSPDSGTPAAAEPEPDNESGQWLYSSTGIRVLQACNPCRRRKTKCSGRRPACSACVLRNLPCTWPSNPETRVTYGQSPGDNVPAPLAKRRRISRMRPPDPESGGHPSLSLLRRALEIFQERHFAVEFCSFLHMPSVDAANLRRASPFLAHALIALSGLYMSQDEAAEQGFTGTEALSEWYTTVARDYSRQSVDAPSISCIQANLVLALRELLARTYYKAWIFTGIAIRQSQALRLGVEYHSRLPNRQREVQRRTFWAAFIMDRMISHCCWRPQMLDSDVVRLNLPCPENTFMLQESFTAPNLETISFPCAVSRFGLMPYFITVLHLWSQASYSHVKGGRRHARSGPDDSNGFFMQHEKKMDQVYGSLSSTMRWSAQNVKLFRHMKQSAAFVNLHLLLHHARCVMHQEYLPYHHRHTSTSASRHETHQFCREEGHRCAKCLDERIASRCLSSSEAILEVVNDLSSPNDKDGNRDLQSVFAASALLCAANVQLWAHYVHHRTSAKGALAKVDQVEAVFTSWKREWPIADAWISTLDTLRRLYRAAYVPDDVQRLRDGRDSNTDTSPSSPPTLTENEAYDRPYPHLTEGNGLPELHEQMSDKVRFILLGSLEDAGARERVLSSSMGAQVDRPDDDHDGDAQDIGEFDFQHLYTDNELWSGLDVNYALGGVGLPVDSEHDVFGNYHG